MITKEKIVHDFQTIKARAIKYFESSNFEKCLTTIESAAFLAYNFNFFYYDDELEDIIKKIGKNLGCNTDCYTNKQEHYIFYDSFGWDNRGLTQQYLRAILASKVKVTYILESDNNVNSAKDILNELQAYQSSIVKLIPENLTKLEKIKMVSEIVNYTKPTKIFTHKTPWNTIGNAVFSNVTGIDVFHINLTDHAFWLGKNAANNFLEFRNYGANISINYRLIPKEKVFILPYYPIFNATEFQGFPEGTETKIKLFTGANFYKMYGDNEKFFDLIKNVLNSNLDAILLIAGSGYQNPMIEFIGRNKFEKRIILLGDRKDINAVFDNIDIYIPTYPYTGGLMVQFAALSQKPIIAYTDKSLPFNIVEELIDVKDHKLTYFNENEFYEEIQKLIKDKEYRHHIGTKFINSVSTITQFNSNFLEIVNQKKEIVPFENYYIDVDKFANIYLESENKYLHAYDSFIFGYFRAVGWKIEPKYYISTVRHLKGIFQKRFF